jgi:RNA-binding protein
MLKNTQKAQLRAMGNGLSAIFQIGKDGISLNMLNSLDDALEAHELVKIQLLKTAPISVNEAAVELSRQLRCEVVQTIGKVVIIYRASEKQLIKFN